MTEAKERTYSDEEIKARLARELPHWYLEGGWIRRKYSTHSWKGTLMVINTVGHLAEAAWHHPDITASYAWVEVRLQNHAAKGITDKDFDAGEEDRGRRALATRQGGRRARGHAGERSAVRLRQIRRLTPVRRLIAAPVRRDGEKPDVDAPGSTAKTLSFKAAIAEAARLLAASRLPVIAGLGTDIAGARAAIALAEPASAPSIDHMHADALLRSLDVMRERACCMTTTPPKRGCAPITAALGGEPVGAWPEQSQLPRSCLARDAEARRADHCGSALAERRPSRERTPIAHIVGRDPADLPIGAGSVARAHRRAPRSDRTGVAAQGNRRPRGTSSRRRASASPSGRRRTPRRARDRDAAAASSMDLNASTRFSGSLPIEPPDNAAGVLQACGWMTGCPMRTGFARGTSASTIPGGLMRRAWSMRRSRLRALDIGLPRPRSRSGPAAGADDRADRRGGANGDRRRACDRGRQAGCRSRCRRARCWRPGRWLRCRPRKPSDTHVGRRASSPTSQRRCRQRPREAEPC